MKNRTAVLSRIRFISLTSLAAAQVELNHPHRSSADKQRDSSSKP